MGRFCRPNVTGIAKRLRVRTKETMTHALMEYTDMNKVGAISPSLHRGWILSKKTEAVLSFIYPCEAIDLLNLANSLHR